MIVNARPFPNYRVLLSKNCDNSIFLNGSLEFYKMGRDALLQALLQLKVNKNDLIVVPGYICKSTLGPIINAGYRIKFIDINSDFGFNKSELINLFDNESVGAVIPVHYFGFPATDLDFINKICKKNNIPMIEDCCHQFLSKVNNEYLGFIGEAAIYSMRKTIPVSDGGALRIKSKLFKIKKQKPKWKFFDIYYLILRLIEKFIVYLGWPNIYSKKIDLIKNKSVNSDLGYNHSKINNPSNPSRILWSYITNTNYLENIEDSNRNLYDEICKRTKKMGFKIMHPHLPDGVVPQVLSVWDDSQKLLIYLRERGIGASSWPGKELPSKVLNNKKYKTTNDYDKKWVHIPIHSDISFKQKEYIIKNMLKWRKKLFREN
tara:strand:- start:619 stop:1743 length:1125 start_codon:yes stop_codon:yes gene_type:complete